MNYQNNDYDIYFDNNLMDMLNNSIANDLQYLKNKHSDMSVLQTE